MPELDKVHFATVSRYDFDQLQKDDDYFYFVLEDDGRYSLYVGDKLTSNAISIVEAFPPTGEAGRFFLQLSTGIIKIWTTEWVQVFPAEKGDDGLSAFEDWQAHGHTGASFDDFMAALKGPKGDTGPTGPQGPQGVQGIQGPKGDTGATGATGAQGPTGPAGATGLQGPAGADGSTPNIDVTSVMTLPAGTPAEARITGTSPDLHLELKIPQGMKGDTGETGPTGPQGDKGDKGDTGDKGDKGDTPVLTADTDGTIKSDGVVLTQVLKNVAQQAESDHTRAESDHAVVEGYDTRLTAAEGEINQLTQRFLVSEDFSSVYTGSNGYFRVDGTSPRYVSATNFRVTELIPIKVGDVINTNSSIVGNSTTGHVYFGANGRLPSTGILGKFSLASGSVTITQAMWDAGARYVSLSFLITTTPSPQVTRVRSLSNELFQYLSTQTEKIHVVPVDADNFNVFVPQKNGKHLCYHFIHQYKKWDELEYIDENGNTQIAPDVVSADCWNNDKIFDGDNVYLMQGNTNFIVQIRSDSVHTGDGHGNEVMLFCSFFADGQEFNPTETEKECDVFRFMWRSNVYRPSGSGNAVGNSTPQIDTLGNPIVAMVHLLDAFIDYGGIQIKNRLQVQQDNIGFNQCLAAMLEIDYGKFTTIAMNTSENTINAISSTGVATTLGGSNINLSQTVTNKAHIVEMFGDNFFVRQSMKPIDRDFSKCVVYSAFYDDRLKCYFMPVGCSHFSVDVGISPQTFNTGDVIAVDCQREIELS